MRKQRVRLTFTQENIAEPIIYNLVQQFRIITNIRQANLSENEGWIIVDFEGEEKDVEAGIAWAISKGVRVEPINDT